MKKPKQLKHLSPFPLQSPNPVFGYQNDKNNVKPKISDTLNDLDEYKSEIELLRKAKSQYEETFITFNVTLTNSASYSGRTGISYKSKLARRVGWSLKNYYTFRDEYMDEIEESYKQNPKYVNAFKEPYELYRKNLNGKKKEIGRI